MFLEYSRSASAPSRPQLARGANDTPQRSFAGAASVFAEFEQDVDLTAYFDDI